MFFHLLKVVCLWRLLSESAATVYPFTLCGAPQEFRCCHWFDSSSYWGKTQTFSSCQISSFNFSESWAKCTCSSMGRAVGLLTGHPEHPSRRWCKRGVSSLSSLWVPLCPFSFPYPTFLFCCCLAKLYCLRVNTIHRDSSLWKPIYQLPPLLKT